MKNHDNIVLHPESAIPLQKYILFEKKSMYHDLSSKSYKSYRYDEISNNLIYTNEIEFL